MSTARRPPAPASARSEPGLSARAVRPVLAGLKALGHDVERLLAAAGIDAGWLGDPEARVPHGAMMKFWGTAVATTGDADLGLHVAEAAPVRSFDVNGYAFLSSPTLLDAYERACRYQRLIHETTALSLEQAGAGAALRHALPGGRPVPRQSAEFLAATWVRFGRLVTGSDWAPLEVRFAHPRPERVVEHERIFRAPLRFASGENAVVVPAAALAAPNARGDPDLAEVLDRYAGSLLSRLPRSPATSDRIRAALLAAMQGSVPGAASCARRLHMSTRTLHRRLAEEGTTFGALLDQVRHEEAARLLAAGGAAIAEVAFLLGFSELSAFYRAFRRWTGTTPAAFRAGAPPAPRPGRRRAPS